MNVSTVDALSDALTGDMTWRLREISDLKHAAKIVSTGLRDASIRATIPIFYAHWEGHVRVCATAYVQHVALKRLHHEKLRLGYMLAPLRAEFDRIASKQISKIEQLKFIEKVFSLDKESFRSRNNALVDTRSNLSFDSLCEILDVIGIDKTIFETDQSFIDKILVHKRNNIAHGQDILLSVDEMDEIADRTIILMRTFQNIVENAALLRTYER